MRKRKDAPGEIDAEATYRTELCYQAKEYNKSAKVCMEEIVKRFPAGQHVRQAMGPLCLWGALKRAGAITQAPQWLAI